MSVSVLKRRSKKQQNGSHISNTGASKSGRFYVELQNRKRNNTVSEIPLEEVVIIFHGRNQSEESAVTLHNLPRMVSLIDHSQ